MADDRIRMVLYQNDTDRVTPMYWERNLSHYHIFYHK